MVLFSSRFEIWRRINIKKIKNVPSYTLVVFAETKSERSGSLSFVLRQTKDVLELLGKKTFVMAMIL